MKYRLIDLFCGAGGLTLGFVSDDKKLGGGGFKSVWALDSDKAAAETYRANFGNHVEVGDIEEYVAKGSAIPKADVVIGGPPCQGFSLLNKQRAGDVRRQLWEPFLDVVRQSEARVFVIENVSWLLTAPELDEIEARADELGFKIVPELLNAADYGTPQTRRRAVILGWEKSAAASPQFPPKEKRRNPDGSGPSKLKPWRTVRDAIGKLPAPVGDDVSPRRPPLDLHFGRNPTAMSIERYEAIPTGGNRFDLQKNRPDLTPECWKKKKTGGTDLFGRLWWDRPSVTIRTEFFKPEKGRYLHPDQNRPITHREAARLMGFPDSFKFKGSKIEIARQIGNAVPPHLAGSIAAVVRGLLDEMAREMKVSRKRRKQAAGVDLENSESRLSA